MIDDNPSFLSRNLSTPRFDWLRRGSNALLALIGCSLMALLLLANRIPPFDHLVIAGMILVSLGAMLLTWFHLRHTTLDGTSPRVAERMIWLTAFLSVSGVQILSRSLEVKKLLGVGFLMTAPLVAQAMLLSALLGPAISLFALTVVALLLGISQSVSIEMLTASWLAGAVGAHAVNPLKQRGDLLRAMTVQVLALAAIASCVSAVSTDRIGVVLQSAGWAALAAIGATAIFWLAVAVLERIFGITSDWSLLELSSPDHPLLKELCVRAPGTYAHSVMVGNLSESAARAIGANPVLCRAMAYFHDVGKITRPSLFIENQLGGPNPHDDLSPSISAVILRAHVEDGLQLAKRHRLPKIIADGIAQHHGTCLMGYFYGRALEQHGFNECEPLLEKQYRYPGPKPQTRETAILLLADCVEAVTRTIGRGSSEDLEIAVGKIIEERRADGQLDECDLTLRDLTAIRQAFLRSLCAIRHERVSYPGVETHEPPAQEPDHDFQHVVPETPDDAHSYGA